MSHSLLITIETIETVETEHGKIRMKLPHWWESVPEGHNALASTGLISANADSGDN